ncbi:hypothetical protein Tco_1217650 [Tanacetum coccineum]
MDPNSSVGKTCLGENVIEISNEKAEGHRDWNSPEYQDTTNRGGKKETKAIVFHNMDIEKVSDRYVAPCFVNGLEAYDDHEVKRRNKVVKKELIISLRGEIYFVNFIINPEEDDIKPGVILGRSFMRLTKGIAEFRNETITIYPELDPFLDSVGEEEKIGDDWDLLLDDLDFGDIPDIEGVKVPPFICKMGKSSRNKRKQLEKFQLIYSDMGPSLSTGKPLTQEEAKRVGLAVDICKRYSLLEEERPVIKTRWRDEERGRRSYNQDQRRSTNRKGGPWSIRDTDSAGRITSTFDGLCPQTFRATKTSLDTAESDSDDEEECFNKEEGDGQWHAEIRLTDPYGNIYDQGFVTKKTSRRLSKYHKLSDIMSPNQFQE